MKTILQNLIRPHYQTLQGYISAGMESAKNERHIFLNANENPYELPGLEGMNRYPKPQPPELLDAYAKLYEVNPDTIVMARGADEAIAVLTKLLCDPHQDSVLICPPTFGMYAVNARAMPVQVLDVPLIKENGTFALNTQAIIETAQAQKPKIVYLCSPNNPTGNSFPREALTDICEALRGSCAVVVDETYIEFSEQDSLANTLTKFPNLIILRTLSKSFSLAGMRMGVMITGDTGFVEIMREKGLDAYPLPVASINAALTVAKARVQEIARQNIKTILQERTRVISALENHALVDHIYPTDANFFLLEMEATQTFIQFCADHEVILRDFSQKPLTKNCIRISIGLPDHNDKLLTLFDEFKASYQGVN